MEYREKNKKGEQIWDIETEKQRTEKEDKLDKNEGVSKRG